MVAKVSRRFNCKVKVGGNVCVLCTTCSVEKLSFDERALIERYHALNKTF